MTTDSRGEPQVWRTPATGVAPPHHSAGGPLAVVTGSGGFIGRHLVDRLAGEGWRVRGLDLEDPPRPNQPAGDRVSLERADVRDPEAMEHAFARADTVFHLASAHLEHGAHDEWYRSVNVEGARTVAAAAARVGVRRLVHTSSVGIYGNVKDIPADEDSPTDPVTAYERTKLQGEDAVLEVARDEELDVIILRPGWVYGPGCRRTEKLLRTVRRRRFAFVGDGSNLRHPLFISDMLDAFLLAADAPAEAAGRAYLIVGPQAVTVRELVGTCARVQGVEEPTLRLPRRAVAAGLGVVETAFSLVGRRPPVSRRSLAFFENDNAFSGQAALRDLGFEASTDLESGLRMTLQASEDAA